MEAQIALDPDDKRLCAENSYPNTVEPYTSIEVPMVKSKGVQKSEAPAKPNLLRQIQYEHHKQLMDLAKNLLRKTNVVVDEKIILRRIYLKPADFLKHGYSDGAHAAFISGQASARF